MNVKQTDIICPHCGHPLHIELDVSNGDQDYYEDCANCCNPIHVKFHIDDQYKNVQVNISSDDDQIY